LVSPLNSLLKKILVLAFLVVPVSGFIHSTLLAFPHQDPQPQLEIQVEIQNIHILAKEYPLGKLLQSIQEKTGIQFRTPEPLDAVPVNARIIAKDWKSALKKLFRENSRFEVWGGNLTTSKIWLYEYENHPVSSGDFIVRADAKENLSKNEILRLARKATHIEQRLMAMEHFSYLGEDEEIIPLLIFNLKARQAKIRATSLTLFKNITEPIPLTHIAKVAQSDKDAQIRMQALSLIAERADEERSKPLLLQALNDPSMKLRNLAEELLNDLGLSET
jgi:hypothetical protein